MPTPMQIRLEVESLGMTIVRQLLDQKGCERWSIGPDKSVHDAIKMMAEKDIGALMVIEGDELVGIVTERQYTRSLALKGKRSLDTQVCEIMERPVLSVGPNETVENCMALMTENGVRHLPVLSVGTPIGVLSIGDLVKSIIRDQQSTISHLEHYIHGRAVNG
jgi:signal-transduction protein with cAMP-binding, CBS, and nucleotidyltransferase domain